MRYARFGVAACAGLLWAAAWAGGENWKLGKHATRTGDVVKVSSVQSGMVFVRRP